MSSLSSLVTSQPQELLLEEETLKRLSNGYSLELIASAQSIALMCSKGAGIVRLERLTTTEWRLLMVLYRAFPHYCPYGTLFAVISGISTSQGNESITNAQANGTVNMILEPMRSTLSRLRRKLAPFKIALLSINTIGYSLVPAEARIAQKTGENTEKHQYEEEYDDPTRHSLHLNP